MRNFAPCQFAITQVVILVVTACFAGKAVADQPPPNSVTIQDLQYWGSGCRQGSAVANVSPDRQAFTILFDSFTVDSTTDSRLSTKRCELDLKVAIPAGWSFAVTRLDVRGYVSTSQRGDYAQLTSKHKFALTLDPFTTIIDDRVRGPFDGDYQLNGVVRNPSSWSSCGRTAVLRIDTRLTVATLRDGQSAYATVDSVDGEAAQTYSVRWRRCR